MYLFIYLFIHLFIFPSLSELVDISKTPAPHSSPAGGGNAPKRCLSTAIKSHEEEEVDSSH